MFIFKFVIKVDFCLSFHAGAPCMQSGGIAKSVLTSPCVCLILTPWMSDYQHPLPVLEGLWMLPIGVHWIIFLEKIQRLETL